MGFEREKIRLYPILPRRSFLLSLGAATLASCDASPRISLPETFGIEDCPRVPLRAPYRGENAMRTYEDDFLLERRLTDTPHNREIARQRVGELREKFKNVRSLRGHILLGIGADKWCGRDDRIFVNPSLLRRMEEHARVTVFSGIPEQGEPTREQIIEARDTFLEAIRKTAERIAPTMSTHGSVRSVSFGYGGSTDTEATPRLSVTPEQLGDAAATRFSDTELRKYAEEEPEVFTFETCGSGGYGKAVLRNLQHRIKRQGWEQGRSPAATISSTTGTEIGYTETLLPFLTDAPEISSLYKKESHIGSMFLYSNPEVHVMDPETGDVTKIV